jgi:regulatory protein
MRIESIEKARKGAKFAVSLDDGTSLLLSREVIIDFGLRKNDELSEDTVTSIMDAQLYRDAYYAAGRLLDYRMRTRSELDQRLLKKGYPEKVVAKVIGKMSELGLIDDSRFADAFIASKIAGKPIGKRELERGLREKGISKEAAQAAVLQVSDDDTQLELAIQAAKTKMRSLRKFEPRKRQEKLVAFLARRGFDWDVIKKGSRQIFKGDEDAVDF